MHSLAYSFSNLFICTFVNCCTLRVYNNLLESYVRPRVEPATSQILNHVANNKATTPSSYGIAHVHNTTRFVIAASRPATYIGLSC